MQIKNYSSYAVAILATIVRYYDYALFGLSASVLSEHFMPGADEDIRLVSFFAIFSLSVIAKPFGSLIFGKIGDNIGRVVSVKIAVFMAAISTLCIAFIPDYKSAGWLSVILLMLLRMLFLLSLAGETDAVKLYISEKVGRKNRHFAAGVVAFSSQIGVMIASVAYYMSISSEQSYWMWRVNFIAGGVLGFIVLLMRGVLQESEEFVRHKSKIAVNIDDSTWQIITKNKMKFALSVVMSGMIGGGYHFLIIFLGAFIAKSANLMSIEDVSYGNIILIAIYGVACLISGYIADRVNVIMQASVALMVAIFSVLFMEFMLELNLFSVFFHRVIVFTAPFYTIPCYILMQSIFPVGIRMRMYSLSHSIGSVLFSSTTPFVCMLLWQFTDMISLVLVYFLLQLGLLFFALIGVTKQNYANMFER